MPRPAGADVASARAETGERECSWRPIPTARCRRGRIVPASHDDLDRVPTPDPTVRAASRVLTAHAGEEVCGRFDHRRLRCRRLECHTGGGEPGPLVAAGEQPVVAQALEAGRQHVAQEASDEGVGRQAHRTFAAGFVVAHPKAHLARIAAEQAVIRERHAVRVAGKVIEHLGGSAWRRLGVDHLLTAVDSRTNPASTAGTAQHDLDLVSG